MCQVLVGFECESPAQLHALEVVDLAVLEAVLYKQIKILVYNNNNNGQRSWCSGIIAPSRPACEFIDPGHVRGV